MNFNEIVPTAEGHKCSPEEADEKELVHVESGKCCQVLPGDARWCQVRSDLLFNYRCSQIKL